MNYYVYQYLRENGTPYYIGMGKGKRAYNKHYYGVGCIRPKDLSRIDFLYTNITQDQAWAFEIFWIAVYGRKDLGTGILYNRTNGGGTAATTKGKKLTGEHKQKISAGGKGTKRPPFSEEHKRKLSEKAKLRTPWNKGIPMSDECKQQQSLAHIGKNLGNKSRTGMKDTQETKLKKSDAQKHRQMMLRKEA